MASLNKCHQPYDNYVLFLSWDVPIKWPLYPGFQIGQDVERVLRTICIFAIQSMSLMKMSVLTSLFSFFFSELKELKLDIKLSKIQSLTFTSMFFLG